MCTLVLMTAGVQVGTAAVATAAGPAEVAVIPADTGQDFLPDRIAVAGATGFLHQYELTGPPLWTRYADGVTTVLDDLPIATAWQSAGGDEVWTTRQIPGHSIAGSLTVLDLGTSSWRTMERPATGTVTAVYGNTMLIRLRRGTAC